MWSGDYVAFWPEQYSPYEVCWVAWRKPRVPTAEPECAMKGKLCEQLWRLRPWWHVCSHY